MKGPLVFVLVILLAGCKGPGPTEVRQGIAGEVWWLEGDFMPRIGENPAGQRRPVQRTVVIYPVLQLNDLEGQSGPLFTEVPAEQVAVVQSDENGKFEVQLPTGTYSVFTREPEGYFANSFDGEGRVNAVVVKTGEITRLVIDINYRATY